MFSQVSSLLRHGIKFAPAFQQPMHSTPKTIIPFPTGFQAVASPLTIKKISYDRSLFRSFHSTPFNFSSFPVVIARYDNNHFSEFFTETNYELSQSMKLDYNNWMTKVTKPRIKQSETELQTELQNWYDLVWETTGFTEFLSTKIHDFEEKFLSKLSENLNQFTSNKAEERILQCWEQCKQGKIESFATMAFILRFSDIPDDLKKNSIELLTKFVELGVENAQESLYSKYTKSDELSIQEKIEGLHFLSMKGHLRSQKSLGIKLSLVGTPISHEDRFAIFHKLIEHEVGFNPIVTEFYITNHLAGINAGLTLEKRMSVLQERAKKGDSRAFEALIDAYAANAFPVTPSSRQKIEEIFDEMDDFVDADAEFEEKSTIPSESLNLTPEQIWNNLCNLRGNDISYWFHKMQNVYLQGQLGSIVVPLTQEERYQTILSNAFLDLSMDEAACKILKNKLESGGMHDLCKLALKGSESAQDIIIEKIKWTNPEDLKETYRISHSEAFDILAEIALKNAGNPWRGEALRLIFARLYGFGYDNLWNDPHFIVTREAYWNGKTDVNIFLKNMFYGKNSSYMATDGDGAWGFYNMSPEDILKEKFSPEKVELLNRLIKLSLDIK